MLNFASRGALKGASFKCRTAVGIAIAALCTSSALAAVTITIMGRTFAISPSKLVIKPVSGSAPSVPSVPSVPQKPKRPGLGLNLAQVSYFLGERALLNLAQGAGWQASVAGRNGWTTFDPARVDDLGAVRSLLPGESANKALVPPEGAFGTNPVKIRCSWLGKGALMPRGGASRISQGANSFEFDWAPAETGPQPKTVWIELSQTDLADPLRTIDCREKSASTPGFFSPAFVQSLAGYKVLRFMDWQNTNANASVTWATRVRPEAQDQSGVLGASVEHMVALANEASADPWFAMPWNADEDYIRGFATYVRDNLAPGRKVYVEMSNEIWNSAFPVAVQAQAEGLKAGLSANAFEARLRRYAEKSTWMHKIWTDVFKSTPDRLVRVVSTQNHSSWTAETVLSFGDTAQYTDALATAPYFGGALFDGVRSGWANLDQIFAWLDADIDDALARAIDNKAVAARRGKRYIAYEGGQHVVNPNNIALVAAINRDERMYRLYAKYLSQWQIQIGDTMTLFASTSPISQYGAWGLREYAGQPLVETPKRRAALDYIALAN